MRKHFIKYNLFIFFLLFTSCFDIFSQSQHRADSLYNIYLTEELIGAEKLELLRGIAYHEMADAIKGLKISEELIELSETLNDSVYLYRGYTYKGYHLKKIGNLVEALKAFQKALEISKKDNNYKGIGQSLMTLATTYADLGDIENATKFHEQSISHLRNPAFLVTQKDSIILGEELFNASDFYLKTSSFERAILLLNEAGEIFEKADAPAGYNYYVTGNKGIFYAKQGFYPEAKRMLNEAIEHLSKNQDYSAVCAYLLVLSDVYLNEGDLNNARKAAESSLEYSRNMDSPLEISESSLIMAKIDSTKGNYRSAYNHFRNYVNYKEIYSNIEKVREAANSQLDFEISQKDEEYELLEREAEISDLKHKRQKYIMYGSLILMLFIGLLAYGYFRRYQYIKKTKAIIESEMDRSDKLLLNILPKESAKELKINGKVQANRYESVTVMFTDFADFTSHAERLNPELLVQSVDYYFSYFDDIMDKYGLEKIKTLGDSYMCAGGLPFISPDHAHKMVEASRDILEFVEKVNNDEAIDIIKFKIRIGINTGPVIAGIVGKKKFAYDIWGDTVNIASRMESNSEAGKINISEYTYNLVKYDYHCEFRGSVEVKKRGKMNMYFVGDPK